MAAMPPSCSSFQASQPPTSQAFTLLLALLAFRLFFAFRRSSLLLFLLLVFVVRLGALETPTAPLAPKAPRTSNEASAAAPQRPSDVVLLQRKARSSASFPLVFILVLVFVFARFLFSFPRLKPTSPTRRQEPPRCEGSKKTGCPTLPNPRPELSPACPEHFRSQPQKQYSIGLEMTIYRRGLSTHSGRFFATSTPRPPDRQNPFAPAKKIQFSDDSSPSKPNPSQNQTPTRPKPSPNPIGSNSPCCATAKDRAKTELILGRPGFTSFPSPRR